MRIVIDLQGAQSTGSRHRGIGRYSLAISQAIAHHAGKHEILIALNGNFPESMHAIRIAFRGLLPPANICVWSSPGAVNELAVGKNWHRHIAQRVREAFLASLDPDMVIISSFFEGAGDSAVTSIGALTSDIPTAAILYDLIPLINRAKYLNDPAMEKWYKNKIRHLQRADLLLSISESSRQEGLKYLGLSAEDIVNISTDADPQFRPQMVSARKKKYFQKHYQLGDNYVLYTGGVDHRKNVEGLIQAFGQLPESILHDHQLAIVCSLKDYERIHLENLAKSEGLTSQNFVLTGFVSDADLVDIYNLCKLFVFPSKHEGFGLPILEAMRCGRAVIGSNTSSVPEVIGREEAMFNPEDVGEISAKLLEVLSNADFIGRLEKHAFAQSAKFSWEKSAKIAIAAMERHLGHSQPQFTIAAEPTERKRLAYISPWPPQKSGIADYSAELVSTLSSYYDIDVIVTDLSTFTKPDVDNLTLRSVDWLKSNSRDYDRVLYQFGNSLFHEQMFDLIADIPGVVVLHDFYLSGVVSHEELYGKSSVSWAKELYISHGYSALFDRFHLSVPEEAIYKYPCNRSVLQEALGVIVHSETSVQMAKFWYGDAQGDDWAVIPHLRDSATNHDRIASRSLLGFGESDFIICSFGMVNPTKLSRELLESWLSSSLSTDQHSYLFFVGQNDEGGYGASLQDQITRHSEGSRIKITGWSEPEVYKHFLASADVAVQLRTQSRGETSGAVLDCMNYGIATVVNNNGSMATLPDHAVYKLPDGFENNQLVEALESLRFDDTFRVKLGKEAQKIIHENHDPDICGRLYFEAIERSYIRSRSGLGGLVESITAIEEAPPDKQAIAELAAAIDQALRPPVTQPQLLVDVSPFVSSETGAEFPELQHRIIKELLSSPTTGVRVEPIVITPGGQYTYARTLATQLLDCPPLILDDEPANFRSGDTLLVLDPSWRCVEEARTVFKKMGALGIHLSFFAADTTNWWEFTQPDGTEYPAWLRLLSKTSSIVCRNRSLAEQLHSTIVDNFSGTELELNVEPEPAIITACSNAEIPECVRQVAKVVQLVDSLGLTPDGASQ